MALLIIGGPSKWDLMLALFDNSSDAHRRRRITFRCEPNDSRAKPLEIGVEITSISTDGHNGEDWCFEARCNDQAFEKCRHGETAFLKGWFRTDSREGRIWEDTLLQVASFTCVKCHGKIKMVGGHFRGESVFQCLTCRVECDWDSNCHGPFQFVYGDPEGYGRAHVCIAFCSPRNHD